MACISFNKNSCVAYVIWLSRSLRCIVLAALYGCASAPTSEQVVAEVISTQAGIGWRTGANNGIIVELHEATGANHSLSWTQSGNVDPSSLTAFRACLTKLREEIRYADSDALTKEMFLGSKVDNCVQVSDMPPYVDALMDDATSYQVFIRTGNVNSHMQELPGESRLGGYRGSFLGVRRVISRQTADRTSVATDVKQCTADAGKGGVVEVTRLQAGEMSYHSATMAPMIKRFDKCIEARGYKLESSDH